MSTISRRMTIDDVPIRWEEQGEGPAVVLVHGIPTSPSLWRHVMPYLIGTRALAFEMVGYGHSIPAGRERDISVAAQATYLNAWLDHLDIDRAVLVGHDLGGGIAQIAAIGRRERCAGLVLTNTIAYDSWPIPSVKGLRAAHRILAKAPETALKGLIWALLARGHDDLTVARESPGVHYGPYAEHDGPSAMARQVQALDVHDTLSIVDRLPDLRQVPSRIVWGLSDRFQKAVYGERLARDLGTRPAGIPGGKHFTPEDHPRAIAAAIHDVTPGLDAGLTPPAP